MGIGKRLARIIRSNINDLLTAAENPEKQIDLLVSEMEDGLREAKQLLIRALADEKRLQRQLDEADELAQMWADRAQQAVDAGQDDLARQALRKKRQYEELATEYDEQLYQQQQAVDSLREQYRLLEQRLREAKAKRRTLITEVRRQRAQRQTSTGARSIETGAVTDRSAFERFDEMAERIESFEAETSARAEVEALLDDEAGFEDTGAATTRTPRQRRSRDRARREEELAVDIEMERLRSRTAPPEETSAPPTEGAPPPQRRSRRRDTSAPDEAAPESPPDSPGEGPPDDEGGSWGRRVEL